MSELTEQDAEIKRLRAMRLKEYLKLDEKLDALEQKSVSQKVLITELAEWCSHDPESITEHGRALLQRAREATR